MKEVLKRSLSGALYIALFLICLNNQHALTVLFYLFGMVCLWELKKLIKMKSVLPYVVFTVLYFVFGYWQLVINSVQGLFEATQILQVITIFVQLFLLKELFLLKTITFYKSTQYLLTTFYLSSAFVFLILIANHDDTFSPLILLGSFILVWINDTFAFLIGKSIGKQKLFEKISPKKTVEGFLGGVLFSCIASYFIATFTETLNFNIWLGLAIIVSVFGTLGDLVESKLKRQANVKDSGTIMPGHGGLLDRLDSIIFASPIIFLYLSIVQYVS